MHDASNFGRERFALLPLESGGFVAARPNVAGIVNRRIESVVATRPRQSDSHADRFQRLIEKFRVGRG